MRTPAMTRGLLHTAWALWLIVSAPTAGAQEWTRFRGPNGAGRGKGEAIPARWTQDDYLWKVKLPGGGHGSPVLWGERIFLICANERTAARIVVCLNAKDGSVRWQREYASPKSRMNRLNHYGATTPAVDADRLYVAWSSRKSIVLRALDHEGKDLWDRDLGAHRSQHGPCTSPMVFEDTVVMTNDQQGESFLLAVSTATGETRWKLPRTAGRAAYSTPCIRRTKAGETELITTSTADGITAVDPRSGRVLWAEKTAMPLRCVGSPALAGDLVIAASGTGPRGNLVAVRATGGQAAKVAYRFTTNAPYVPCPLVVGERMFLFGDAGHVTCLRTATGKLIWQEKVADRFFGSPVLAGGRIYCIARKGNVYVLEPADEYKLLAKIPLGEESFATPAVAGGRMYLRTVNHLIAIGQDKPGR